MFFTTILTTVTKLPSWVKTGVAVGLLFLVFEIRHKVELGHLHKQLATVTQQVEAEQLKNDQLTVSIGQQNLAIDRMRVQNQQIAQEAASRALKVLRQSQVTSEQLKSPKTTVPSGADGMNDWLKAKMKEVQ